MGQSACNKCSDVSLNKNAPRALDDTDSEDEGSEADDEGSEGADNKDVEEEEQEEAKRGAELALQEGLKRGKTSNFTEAVEYSREVGLDEEKIMLAEKKLEEHKASRRREAFEAELHDFLVSEEANDIGACQDKQSQGRDYGIAEKLLKSLQDKIAELELMKELNKEEIEQAKHFLELCTRRFVASCIATGRDVHWIDLESGEKHQAVLKMDIILKNLTVTGAPDGDLTCKVAEITTRRAVNSDEVTGMNGFSHLNDEDRANTVAVLLPDGQGPWCFLESSTIRQDEFIICFQVFNDCLKAGTTASSPSGSPKGKKDRKSRPSPVKTKELKIEDSNEEAVTGSMTSSNLRSAAEGEGEGEGSASPTSPISPGSKSPGGSRKSVKRKTSTKDKKSSVKVDKVDPAEEPPLPPPADNEAAEAEKEASE